MNSVAEIDSNKNIYVSKLLRQEFYRKLKKQKSLVFLSIPFVIYIFIFNYFPVWGWVMAFQEYKPHLGIGGSKWVGLQQFKFLFSDETFIMVLRNTLAMSFLNIVTGMIAAITLAVFINEIRKGLFKKCIQTVSYLPHFLSWVVAANIVISAFDPYGIINKLLVDVGAISEPILFLGKENFFWGIIAVSNIWKDVGWNAIIYLAAMTSIDSVLYEAASIDGAGRIQKIFKITIPGIMPTIKILLVMQSGMILSTGFEQQYLIGNSTVMNVAEVLDWFILRYGISMGRFSFATAAGVFKSIVGITLLLIVNSAVKKMGEDSVF